MTTPKGRILCTDDDADTRDLIVTILSLHNFEVICANDADEALKLAQTKPFDLYLLDHWMPGISGVDLTREIRKFDQNTPILFFSGAIRDADQRVAYEAGAQAYILKPASPDILLAEVKRLLSMEPTFAAAST